MDKSQSTWWHFMLYSLWIGTQSTQAEIAHASTIQHTMHCISLTLRDWVRKSQYVRDMTMQVLRCGMIDSIDEARKIEHSKQQWILLDLWRLTHDICCTSSRLDENINSVNMANTNRTCRFDLCINIHTEIFLISINVILNLSIHKFVRLDGVYVLSQLALTTIGQRPLTPLQLLLGMFVQDHVMQPDTAIQQEVNADKVNNIPINNWEKLFKP